MANEAFQSGFDKGFGRADDERLHARALADQEHQQKLNDLIGQRQELAAKIPTLDPASPEYKQAHDALQQVNLNLADAYHPAKNPGAIEKFGHLLTDHVGLTNPQDRAAKAATQLQLKTDAAGKATDQQIAAAPQSPEAANAAKIQAQIKLIDASNLSDEDKTAARQKVFGIATKSNYQQFTLPDGRIGYYDVTHPDDIPEGATAVPKGSPTAAKESIAEYQKQVAAGQTALSFPAWQAQQRRVGAPSTSAFSVYTAAYARAYGLKPDQLTREDLDFITKKMAYDKAIPQSTTTNTVKQNFQEQWVPIQETNTKSPGGAAPMPPRGKPVTNTPPPTSAEVSAADSPAANVPAPAGVPPAPAAAPPPAASPSSPTNASPTPSRDPKALKKEAEARRPKASSGDSGSSTPRATGANASVKVGDPLMAAPSKEYREANTAYHSAITRRDQMYTYLKDALKGNQQAQLGLLFNHIGMTQGAQKGSRQSQKTIDEAKASTPWIDAKIAEWFHQDQTGDYIFDGLKGGVNLTKPQMEQMVELADEGVKAQKKNVEVVEDALNEGVSHPSKGSAARKSGKTDTGSATAPDAGKAKGTVSIAKAKTLDKYKHMTDDQISAAITKSGYLPIP